MLSKIALNSRCAVLTHLQPILALFHCIMVYLPITIYKSILRLYRTFKSISAYFSLFLAACFIRSCIKIYFNFTNILHSTQQHRVLTCTNFWTRSKNFADFFKIFLDYTGSRICRKFYVRFLRSFRTDIFGSECAALFRLVHIMVRGYIP